MAKPIGKLVEVKFPVTATGVLAVLVVGGTFWFGNPVMWDMEKVLIFLGVATAASGTVLAAFYTGTGLSLAMAADVRIAAESAKIAYLFTRVGLSGADMGSAWMLPRIVGLGIATELLMSGEFIDPHRAERIGLYNRVVADADLPRVAREYAEKLAQGPSYALGITKDALNREAAMDLAGALEAEAQAVVERTAIAVAARVHRRRPELLDQRARLA